MTEDSNNTRQDQPSVWLNRTVAAAPLAAVLAVAALLAHHSLTDLDIWFHLRAGRDLLAGAGFPRVNTYAFTDPGFPWLNHEWLYQMIITWTAPRSGDLAGAVSGWHAVRMALILSLVATLALGDGTLARLRSGASPLPVALKAAVILFGLLLVWPRFNLRPELVSYLLFIVFVRNVESYYNRRAPASVWRDHGLWRLFGLVLLWAQCHGFAALGPIMILLAIALRPLAKPLRLLPSAPTPWPGLAIWLPFALSVSALVLTPNMWHGLVFPFRALGQLGSQTADLGQNVSELVPLLETLNSLGLTLLVFKVSLVWGLLYVVLGWGGISGFRVVLWALAAFAAVSNQRNIAIYGLALVLLHSGHDAPWPTEWWRHKLRLSRADHRLRRPLVEFPLVVVILAACAWWGAAVLSNDFYLREGVGRRFGTGLTPATYPQAACAALTGPGAERTFANLDAAAFVLANSDARVFIDGRTEAYPFSRWAQYARIKQGGAQALTILDEQRVSAIVLSLRSGAFGTLAATLRASTAWSVQAAGTGGILFVRGNPDPSASGREILLRAARAALADLGSDPTRAADVCLAVADLQQLGGDQEAARQTLELGLQMRPEHPVLNHNLGNLLLGEQKFREAIPLFERALDRNGRLAGSALNIGVCQLRLNQPGPAAASFRRSLDINPRQVAGWVNLAVALHSSNRPGAAIRAMENALALEPGNTRLRRQLADWRRNTN